MRPDYALALKALAKALGMPIYPAPFLKGGTVYTVHDVGGPVAIVAECDVAKLARALKEQAETLTLLVMAGPPPRRHGLELQGGRVLLASTCRCAGCEQDRQEQPSRN